MKRKLTVAAVFFCAQAVAAQDLAGVTVACVGPSGTDDDTFTIEWEPGDETIILDRAEYTFVSVDADAVVLDGSGQNLVFLADGSVEMNGSVIDFPPCSFDAAFGE